VLLGQILSVLFLHSSDKGKPASSRFDDPEIFVNAYMPLLSIIFFTIRYGDSMRASVDVGFSTRE
jgi:hypothetical protein